MGEVPQQPVTVAQVARIGIDLPCITCGYNLRSLPMSGQCPKCNSEIEWALRGGWLMFADPQWLRRLLGGVTLILWTLLVWVICYIGPSISWLVFYTPGGGAPPNPMSMLIPKILMPIVLGLAWLISVIKLTTPEPAQVQTGQPQRDALAKWILALNAMAIFLVVGSVLWDVLMATAFTGLVNPNVSLLLSVIASNTAVLVGMVGFFLLMILMRRIARRVPRNSLGKLVSALIWSSVGLGVGWVAVLLFKAGSMAYLAGSGAILPVTTGPASSAPTTMPVLAGDSADFFESGWIFRIAFLLIFACAALGWSLCGMVALIWFRRVFRRAIVENAAHQIESVARP